MTYKLRINVDRIQTYVFLNYMLVIHHIFLILTATYLNLSFISHKIRISVMNMQKKNPFFERMGNIKPRITYLLSALNSTNFEIIAIIY